MFEQKSKMAFWSSETFSLVPENCMNKLSLGNIFGSLFKSGHRLVDQYWYHQWWRMSIAATQSQQLCSLEWAKQSSDARAERYCSARDARSSEHSTDAHSSEQSRVATLAQASRVLLLCSRGSLEQAQQRRSAWTRHSSNQVWHLQ